MILSPIGFKTPQETEEIRKKFEEAKGHPNSPLPNLRKITEMEFAQSQFFTTPLFWGYDSVYDPRSKNRPMLQLHCFIYHDNTGIAISRDYWKGEVEFWSFGLCEHQYEEISHKVAKEQHGIPCLGNFDHVKRCSKCGYIWVVNSSD